MEEMIAGYNDLGMVEIWRDDSQDIFKILDLENTSIDKLTYTVSIYMWLKCICCRKLN